MREIGRTLLKYGLMVTPPLVGIWIILQIGQGLTAATVGSGPTTTAGTGTPAALNVALLLLQVAVIIIAARGLGWVMQRIGQPQVVGEMAAGILLGPSFLGWVAPALSGALFPPASLGYINALSQIGLVVFMFLVGLELSPGALRGRERSAITTSHVSILVPFFLGATLALYLYPRLGNGNVPFSHFALFMGVSLSITAFPVLARILTELKLLGTHVGAVAVACAAVDDVSAWSILAGIVFLVRADSTALPFPVTLAGVAAYVLLMLFVIRPLVGRLVHRWSAVGMRTGHPSVQLPDELDRPVITTGLLTLLLAVALGSALVSEALGIHALFGAFLAGAIMPRDADFARPVIERLEAQTMVLLLPLFFALTGLRMSVTGLTSGAMLLDLGLIIGVAVLGKFGGATISARLTGIRWREAGAIGILMNTRGLVELVALNIGLDIGVIPPSLFTLMVFMALVTTFMTTPLLQWIYPAAARGEQPISEPLPETLPVATEVE